MAWHEILGLELIRQEYKSPKEKPYLKKGALLVLSSKKGDPTNKIWIHEGKISLAQSVFATLRDIIAGEYDADRADYLLRDGYLSGSGFGNYDVDRFTRSMRLVQWDKGEFKVVPTIRSLSTIESYLIERYKLYKWVYLHHKVCYFAECVCKVGYKILEKNKEKFFNNERIHDQSCSLEDFQKAILSESDNLRESDKFPPFILFRKGRGTWAELNANFFVNPDYLDDIWFSKEVRGLQISQDDELTDLLKSSLVFRRKNSVSLWKEYGQFKSFVNNVSKLTEVKISGRDVSSSEVASFWDGLWYWLKKCAASSDIKPWLSEFERELKSYLKEYGNFLFHWNDISLFGEFDELSVQRRNGERESITHCSDILARLNKLADNIPFFIYYILGDEREHKKREILEGTVKAFASFLPNVLKKENSILSEIMKRMFEEIERSPTTTGGKHHAQR